MTITMDLPTSFLPNLPRQSFNTLDPLSPKDLSKCITRLRTLLIPGIHGVSSTTTTTKPKTNTNESPTSSSSSSSPHRRTNHQRSSSDISTASSSFSSHSILTTSGSVGYEEPGLDEFERDWAEKWLHGLITRGEGWLAEVEPYVPEERGGSTLDKPQDEEDFDGPDECLTRGDEEQEEMTPEEKEQWKDYHERENVLKDASALISSLAGCAAGGGITRDLVFPLNLSFPIKFPSTTNDETPSTSSSPSSITTGTSNPTPTTSITLKIYDAALSDHTSVGVQTWGSAILLGRIFALDPWRWLFDHLCSREAQPLVSRAGMTMESKNEVDEVVPGPRVLELGTGTGVMAILIRRILDEINSSGSKLNVQEGIDDHARPGSKSNVRLKGGKVLATDYHPLVLDNLAKCIRLNFSPRAGQDEEEEGVPGLETMLLDWSTFPEIVRRWAQGSCDTPGDNGVRQEIGQMKHVQPGDWTLPTTLTSLGDSETDVPPPPLTDQMRDVLDTTWDIIIAADCVYDLSHAEMIRDVVKWTLRLPELDESGEIVRPGGVLHLLSPIRPTYAGETASIIEAFPSSSILPDRKERIRLAQADQEVYANDLDDGVDVNGPVSGNALSARLARFGSMQDVSSGRNTPTSTRHVPSTNNSSGQATPRLQQINKRNAAVASSWSRNQASAVCSFGASGSALVGQGDEHNSVLGKLEREAIIQRTLARDMGRGQDEHWVLATTQRRELDRMRGSGRSDEVEYWWWEIRWC